jgi:hypothetical protein
VHVESGNYIRTHFPPQLHTHYHLIQPLRHVALLAAADLPEDKKQRCLVHSLVTVVGATLALEGLEGWSWGMPALSSKPRVTQGKGGGLGYKV